MTERDGIVFAENDVEILIDGGDCYYEFELNAANTVYEVFFVWQDAYRRGGRFDVPEFDLLERKALSFGGDYDRQAASFWRGTHPRGPRWAFREWDLPGLRTAVHVDGCSTTGSLSARAGARRSRCPGMAWGRWRTAGRYHPRTATSGAFFRTVREVDRGRHRGPASSCLVLEQARRNGHPPARVLHIRALLGRGSRGTLDQAAEQFVTEQAAAGGKADSPLTVDLGALE